MGGVDKGLQTFRGQALAWHAVQGLQAQTLGPPGLIAINANRHQAEYRAWGYPVWSDTRPDFAGPLAGFETALEHCQQAPGPFDYLLTVPCDSPLFPLDLMARLATALAQSGADMALAAISESNASTAQTLRAQPVFCLMKTSLLPGLQTYLAEGGRKAEAWAASNHTVTVPFLTSQDAPRHFFNANTLAQLQELEQK